MNRSQMRNDAIRIFVDRQIRPEQKNKCALARFPMQKIGPAFKIKSRIMQQNQSKQRRSSSSFFQNNTSKRIDRFDSVKLKQSSNQNIQKSRIRSVITARNASMPNLNIIRLRSQLKTLKGQYQPLQFLRKRKLSLLTMKPRTQAQMQRAFLLKMHAYSPFEAQYMQSEYL